MSKSFIRYEFTPAERLLLLRGIHLMLSDLYEEIYFFGFYNDNEDESDISNNVLGFLSGEDNEEEDSEESNFFEDSNQYNFDYQESNNKSEIIDNDNSEKILPDFFDDDEDDDEDFEDIFDEDWRVDREQMDKLISEIKILEDKIISIETNDNFPELDINELEILLDSAYEVKIQIEEDDDEDFEDLDEETDPDIESLHEEIRETLNKMANEDRKQIEEDYEFLVLKQHKDLSSLIYKIKEWIDNYQINSN